jgi:hypothetical protein
MKFLGIFSVGFDITDQILIKFFYVRQILDKNEITNAAVHQLYVDLKKAYDSVKGEVLYNIIIEFGVAMKLVRLIKISSCQ